MIRRTLLALALLAAPAIVVAQQPSPMQGQAPAADTSKAKPAKKSAKKGAKKHAAKPAAKPAAKDTTKTKM
jgi:cell division septation protein DedD